MFTARYSLLKIKNRYLILFVEIGCWKCKKCHKFVFQFTKFLNIIRIFSEYYSYMLKEQNMCHIIIQHFWIFSEYYSYMLKVQNMCHIIIQHFWILSEYFLNIILICWKCKTMSYSLFNIFEFYPYIFGILFVYIKM